MEAERGRCSLIFGQEFKVVGDDYWTWSVRAGRFVRPDGSSGQAADVCVIEAARRGGGKPFRIAVNAAVADEVARGLMHYCQAFEDRGADALLQTA